MPDKRLIDKQRIGSTLIDAGSPSPAIVGYRADPDLYPQVAHTIFYGQPLESPSIDPAFQEILDRTQQDLREHRSVSTVATNLLGAGARYSFGSSGFGFRTDTLSVDTMYEEERYSVHLIQGMYPVFVEDNEKDSEEKTKHATVALLQVQHANTVTVYAAAGIGDPEFSPDPLCAFQIDYNGKIQIVRPVGTSSETLAKLQMLANKMQPDLKERLWELIQANLDRQYLSDEHPYHHLAVAITTKQPFRRKS